MLYPVILSGGSGTRLWPLSRKDYPKQFSRIFGEESLFQACVRRFSGPEYAPPLIVTQSDFRFHAAEQLTETGLDWGDLLLEPEGRNTAPAILCAALHLSAKGHGDQVMVVAPSDHMIEDVSSVLEAVQVAVPAAAEGRLVTLGITPDRPETGYGYLELANSVAEVIELQPVTRFIEKPDLARAEAMLASKRYLWNAGIFVLGIDHLIDAYTRLAPDLVAPCRQAVAEAREDLDFLRLGEAAFASVPEVSIDYAIIEKSDAVSTVPVSCGWSDLGAWDAVWRQMKPDGAGVATAGDVTHIDCRDVLLRSEEDGPRLVALNLDGIAVIAMRDAILVADKSKLSAVKTVVSALKAEDVREAETFPRMHRPWGWYETLALAGRFQVKQIMVPSGRKLSLQSHLHRSEHWVVVTGTALVTIGEEQKIVTENQSVYIPLGTVHRLENPGKVDLHLIEVQTGTYLGEDDITRYEDTYART